MKSFLAFVAYTLLIMTIDRTTANAQAVIVSNPLTKLFFKGIENPVEFYAPFKIREIKIIGGKFVSKIINDSLTNKSLKTSDVWGLTQKSGVFSIIPDCDAHNVEVILIGKKDSTSVFFNLRNLPKPHVGFAGKRYNSETISRGDAISANLVYVSEDEDFAYHGIIYHVTDYKVQITREGKIEEYVCQGTNLSGEVRISLSKIQSGDRIVIYDVNATGNCGLIHLEDRLNLLVQ